VSERHVHAYRRNLRVVGRQAIDRAADKIADAKIALAQRAARQRTVTGWLLFAAGAGLIALRCAL
jgi:ferric-dicitrate binding protein FerR (iron transport regulator)